MKTKQGRGPKPTPPGNQGAPGGNPYPCQSGNIREARPLEPLRGRASCLSLAEGPADRIETHDESPGAGVRRGFFLGACYLVSASFRVNQYPESCQVLGSPSLRLRCQRASLDRGRLFGQRCPLRSLRPWRSPGGGATEAVPRREPVTGGNPKGPRRDGSN